MGPYDVVASLSKRAGVSGVLVADQNGALLAEEDSENPEALAATASFTLSCVTKLGDALALGDPLYIIAASSQRRLGFVQGVERLAALELSVLSTAAGACQEAGALLHET